MVQEKGEALDLVEVRGSSLIDRALGSRYVDVDETVVFEAELSELEQLWKRSLQVNGSVAIEGAGEPWGDARKRIEIPIGVCGCCGEEVVFNIVREGIKHECR